MVRIAGSHPAGPGSIPGGGKTFSNVCLWLIKIAKNDTWTFDCFCFGTELYLFSYLAFSEFAPRSFFEKVFSLLFTV